MKFYLEAACLLSLVQSSSQTLDLEAESTCKAGAADGLLSKRGKSPVSDLKTPDQSNCTDSSQNLCTPESAVGGKSFIPCSLYFGFIHQLICREASEFNKLYLRISYCCL